MGDRGVNNVQVLFHDGCKVCLGIAESLSLSMGGLTVIDPGMCPHLSPSC